MCIGHRMYVTTVRTHIATERYWMLIIIVTEEKKNYCRITRSPKHLLSTCFILNDIKPQYLRAWFCSYELPDPFSCMLTTIYGIPPLPTLAHQCVTMNSPSDLLFLRVRKINRLQQLSFCVVVVVSVVVVVNSICVYSHRRPIKLWQLFTLWTNLAASGQTIFVVW